MAQGNKRKAWALELSEVGLEYQSYSHLNLNQLFFLSVPQFSHLYRETHCSLS